MPRDHALKPDRHLLQQRLHSQQDNLWASEEFGRNEWQRPYPIPEEMCRQFHDAYGTSIAVLRPCSIIDTRLRSSKYDAKLKSGSWGSCLVYRHDLAEACRLAIEKDDLGFQVLHMAGAAEADLYCNTREAGDVLDLEFKGDSDQFRKIR